MLTEGYIQMTKEIRGIAKRREITADFYGGNFLTALSSINKAETEDKVDKEIREHQEILEEEKEKVHEIWSVFKLIDLLNAEVIDNKLWFEERQDYTLTGYLKINGKIYTLWWQFPIFIEEWINQLLAHRIRGYINGACKEIEEWYQKIGITTKIKLNSFMQRGRIVGLSNIPDIVLFEGKVDLNELRAKDEEVIVFTEWKKGEIFKNLLDMKTCLNLTEDYIEVLEGGIGLFLYCMLDCIKDGLSETKENPYSLAYGVLNGEKEKGITWWDWFWTTPETSKDICENSVKTTIKILEEKNLDEAPIRKFFASDMWIDLVANKLARPFIYYCYVNNFIGEIPEMIKRKALVIDCKIEEITDHDITQLQTYRECFPDNSKFGTFCLLKTSREREIKDIGYKVFENVYPERSNWDDIINFVKESGGNL